MLNLFHRRATGQTVTAYANLDNALYPLDWDGISVASPIALLHVAIQQVVGSSEEALAASSSRQQQFSKLLQTNTVYQDWINFTLSGRYLQRSFRAFYQQDKDVFNTDMPDILRHELMRHTQRLPVGQVLFNSGELTKTVRQEKLLIGTLNPFYAVLQALTLAKHTSPATLSPSVETAYQAIDGVESNHGKKNGTEVKGAEVKQVEQVILNIITAHSERVQAFAIKHNKHTREGVCHEVMILDFSQLRLTKEEPLVVKEQPNRVYLLRHYSII